MNDTLTILKKGVGVRDTYRQESQEFTPVATGIPCLEDPDGLGRPREFKSEKQSAESYRVIYMRPYAGLTVHHWLQLASDGVRRNIVEIKPYRDFGSDDPTALHHYEVLVQIVTP